MSFSEEASPGAFPFASDRSLTIDAASSIPLATHRLLSIDALRGFAMFWLIGGREFALGLVACLYPPGFDAVETQLTHPIWQGFVAWDLVMPVFLFVVGASMPLAMAKRCEKNISLRSTYARIARRVLILWILGALLQATKPDCMGLELFSNALQAIAVGYLVTSLALLHLRLGGQIGLLLLLIFGYGVLLMFVPFPGHPAGLLERRLNLPHYIDDLLLGNFRRDHSYTWILSSLGFSATVLLGAMAGHLLHARISIRQRMLWLTVLGAGCLAGGWIWSYWMPWNRHLWTSSMILGAGGISFFLLALSYAVIDVGGIQRWVFPFVVIGANALLAYSVDPIFVWASTTLATGIAPNAPVPVIGLFSAALEIAGLWWVLWHLYQKRIFLRA
jgi:predicted acyltransferase